MDTSVFAWQEQPSRDREGVEQLKRSGANQNIRSLTVTARLFLRLAKTVSNLKKQTGDLNSDSVMLKKLFLKHEGNHHGKQFFPNQSLARLSPQCTFFHGRCACGISTFYFPDAYSCVDWGLGLVLSHFFWHHRALWFYCTYFS
jgi:hypothetical protein